MRAHKITILKEYKRELAKLHNKLRSKYQISKTALRNIIGDYTPIIEISKEIDEKKPTVAAFKKAIEVTTIPKRSKGKISADTYRINKALQAAASNKIVENVLQLSKRRMSVNPSKNIKQIIIDEINYKYPDIDPKDRDLLVAAEKKYWIFPKFSYFTLDSFLDDKIKDVLNHIRKVPINNNEAYNQLSVISSKYFIRDREAREIISDLQILTTITRSGFGKDHAEKIYFHIKRNAKTQYPVNIVDVCGVNYLFDNSFRLKKAIKEYLRIQYIYKCYLDRLEELSK